MLTSCTIELAKIVQKEGKGRRVNNEGKETTPKQAQPDPGKPSHFSASLPSLSASFLTVLFGVQTVPSSLV